MSTTPEGKKKSLKKIDYRNKVYELRKKIKKIEGEIMPKFLLQNKRKKDV